MFPRPAIIATVTGAFAAFKFMPPDVPPIAELFALAAVALATGYNARISHYIARCLVNSDALKVSKLALSYVAAPPKSNYDSLKPVGGMAGYVLGGVLAFNIANSTIQHWIAPHAERAGITTVKPGRPVAQQQGNIIIRNAKS